MLTYPLWQWLKGRSLAALESDRSLVSIIAILVLASAAAKPNSITKLILRTTTNVGVSCP